MRKQPVFETCDKHEWKLETLGRVSGHQGDGCVAFVLIGVGNKCGVIDKLAQTVDALLVVVDRSVHQFLQVFQTCFGFVSLFAFKCVLVSGFEDGGFDDVGRGRKSGGKPSFLTLRLPILRLGFLRLCFPRLCSLSRCF